MKHNVTVPAHVLQDLLFNVELMTAIADGPSALAGQVAKLQACITEQVGNSDVVYDREIPVEGIEVDFDTAALTHSIGQGDVVVRPDIAAWSR